MKSSSLVYNLRETRGKRPLGRDPDRSWWHLRTSVKLFGRSPWLHGHWRQHKLPGDSWFSQMVWKDLESRSVKGSLFTYIYLILILNLLSTSSTQNKTVFPLLITNPLLARIQKVKILLFILNLWEGYKKMWRSEYIKGKKGGKNIQWDTSSVH